MTEQDVWLLEQFYDQISENKKELFEKNILNRTKTLL